MGPHVLTGRQDATLRTLGDHYARGRLSTATLEQRVAVALEAESRHHLAAAVADLPAAGWRARLDDIVEELRGPVAIAFDDEVLHVLTSDLERRAWTVGRSHGCDLTVRDETVSARHARFVRRGGTWSVHDLDSRNGTWVNGERVTRAVLRRGDALLLGALAGRVSR